MTIPSRKWYRMTNSPSSNRLFYLIFNFQAAGTALPSFISKALEFESSLSHEDIKDLKFTASSMYGGKLHLISINRPIHDKPFRY